MTAGQPTTLPPSRWGMTYRGVGDLETATLAVEAAVDDLGMSCRRKALREGAVEIEAVQKTGWFQVLTRGLAQRAIWQIETREDQLAISVDFRLFPWFVGILLGLCGVGAVLILGSIWAYEQPWAPQKAGIQFALTSAFLIGLLTMSWVLVLLGALGGGRLSTSAWGRLLRRIEQAGGYLEPVGVGLTRRFRLAFLLFVGCTIALTAQVVWPGLSKVVTGSVTGLAIVAFLASLAILLIGAVLLVRRSGFSLRAGPVAPGLVSSVAVLCCLLPVVLLSLIHADLAQLREYNDQARLVLAGSVPPEVSSRAEIEKLYRVYSGSLARLRFWGWTALSSLMILLAFGAGFAAFGVRLSVHAWVPLERVSRLREKGVYRDAIAGGSVLKSVRTVFFTFWMIYSVLILGLLALAFLAAGRAVFPNPAGMTFQPVELSTAMLAFALSRPFDDPALTAAIRLGWSVYGLILAAIVCASLGQLMWSRGRTWHALRVEASGDSPEHKRLRDLAADLCVRAGLAPVRLAVRRSRLLLAEAQRVGFPRAERFVAVSQGALRHLGDEELRALLAHELVHLSPRPLKSPHPGS